MKQHSGPHPHVPAHPSIHPDSKSTTKWIHTHTDDDDDDDAVKNQKRNNTTRLVMTFQSLQDPAPNRGKMKKDGTEATSKNKNRKKMNKTTRSMQTIASMNS